jgi:rhamnopyranosyl-N-acetylglucosaminyl-diphospho-decaprenol beta-1,3/1,4-galactofuranosyltransferase
MNTSTAETVCAVIPTFNRRDDLSACLRSLQAQTRRIDSFIVVDNSSADGSAEMVAESFPDVELIRLEQNTGSAGGFHAGLAEGHRRGHTWLWAIDNDVVATPAALQALLAASLEKSLDARPLLLSSLVLWSDDRPHPMNLPWLDQRNPERLMRAVRSRSVPVRWASWASLLVHRDAITKHGLPRREYFLWFDDLEFTARITRTSVGLLVPDSVVHHHTSAPYLGFEDSSGRFYYHVRNGLYTVRSGSLDSREKVRWVWWLIRDSVRYLRRNRFALRELAIIARGVRDGILPLSDRQPVAR